MQTSPVVLLTFANDYLQSGRYLSKLPDELEGIQGHLRGIAQKGGCEVIPIGNAAPRDIFDVVQGYRWKGRLAIFHFGGHASPSHIELAGGGDRLQAVQPEGLLSFLGRQRSLRLVFLNGCYTDRHAKNLVNQRVPVVIGATREIEDNMASACALRFYFGLANGDTIEEAFLSAVNYLQTLNPGAIQKFRRMHIPQPQQAMPEGFPLKIYYLDKKALSWRLREHPAPAPESAGRRIRNTRLDIVKGDITQFPADAIVNSCDRLISMGGGLSYAIGQAAGEGIRDQIRDHHKVPLALGEVAITSGGEMPARYLFHACMISLSAARVETSSQDDLSRAVRSCLAKADYYKVKHIAFPALGTGVARISFRNTANAMLDAIMGYLSEGSAIERISIVLYAREGLLQADLEDFLRTASIKLNSSE